MFLRFRTEISLCAVAAVTIVDLLLDGGHCPLIKGIIFEHCIYSQQTLSWRDLSSLGHILQKASSSKVRPLVSG